LAALIEVEILLEGGRLLHEKEKKGVIHPEKKKSTTNLFITDRQSCGGEFPSKQRGTEAE